MPRDLSRKRSNMGTSQKVTAPIIDKENPQPAIDRIFKEINALKATIGNNAKGTASVPNEGRDGDIRLYSEYGLDGSQGFFIQGKFGEAWASGRLSIDLIKPKTEYSDGPGTPVESYEGGNDGYITSDGVTFEALDNNLDVGDNSDQVARGSHSHDHNSLFITNTGTNTHDEIDTHIADESIHREPGDTVSEISKVDNDTAALGTIDKWARIDHTHVLDQTQTYTFSAQQNFNNSGGTAISAVGDVSIDGNLYVNFASAETGNTQIDNDLNVDGNATIDGDVVLNYVAGNTNNTNTTTIKGRTTIWNEFFIRKGVSPGQSHIDITTDGTNHFTVDVNDSGVTTLSTPDTIDIAATSLRPDTNLTRDLGQLNKKWRTIYAGELFVENLVAQDVMATTGGRIMVAPTTTLKTTLADWSTTIAVEHNIFETDDIAFMQSAPQGFAQTEAMRITSEATATVVPDPFVATDANQDAIDYFAGAGVTKLVSWTVNHNLKHGQWIKIVHNSPTPQQDWSGVYQVFIETDSSLLPTYNNISTNAYLALPSTVIQSPSSGSITITTSPYTYNVTRNINGDAGANNWPIDTAIVNWGHNQGDGFIDITSTQSVYNSLGPTISLHSRSSETTGVNDDWLVPEVARLGNFAGTGYTGNNDFGVMVGSNLENSYQATTNPFVGLVGSQSGLEIFNTDFKMYSGSKLQVLISKYKDSNDVVRNMFALGDEITDSDTGAGADLLFKYDETAGVETNVLTISGNVDLTGNVDITIDSDTIIDAIDHFLPNTNNPNAEGFYLTPRWLGFYKLNDGSPYWPVKLGATADGNTGEPFIELKDHPTNPTSFLKYTINDGLEIAGKVTVLGDPLPDIRGIWGNIDWTFSQGTGQGNVNNQNQYIRTFDTTTSTDRWYIYIKGTDFENNTFQAYYTDHYQGGGDAETDNTQWSALGAMNGENNETRWYSFSIEPSATDISEDKAIKIGKIGNDDGTLRAIVITQSHPVNPEALVVAETAQTDANSAQTAANNAQTAADNAQSTADNAIPGNSDYTTSNNITLGNGSIEIGNATVNTGIYSYGKSSLVSNTAGFYLGTGASNTNQFGINIGNANSFLKYESLNGNLDIQNASINMLFDGDVDIFIGKDIATDASTDGNADDIMIGTWNQQTDVGAAASHGILVKHGSNDYSQIYKGGFNRRGFDYPILIHSQFHMGWPVARNNASGDAGHGVSPREGIGDNGELYHTNCGFGISSYTMYPYDDNGNFDLDEAPFTIYGCNIAEHMNYDHSTVPAGRKLVWSFEKKGYAHEGDDQHLYPRNNTTYTDSDGKTYTKGKFFRPGSVSLEREYIFMHNSEDVFRANEWQNASGDPATAEALSYSSGISPQNYYGSSPRIWQTMNYFWFQIQQHNGHYGYRKQIFPYEIPAGTDISTLFLIAAGTESDGTSASTRILYGDLKIWETEA